MNSDNANSGSTSAATSGTKPPSPETPAEKLNESEYLAQQAEAARLAMTHAWTQIKARLGQGVAPQAWAKEYPWITVGAAAVAGFVATAALVPSKEAQALKKLAAIERALNPGPAHEEPHANGNGKKEGQGIMATVLHEVLNIAKPVLLSMMSAGIGAAMPAAEAHEDKAAPQDEREPGTP
jgi:hypothetical protein